MTAAVGAPSMWHGPTWRAESRRFLRNPLNRSVLLLLALALLCAGIWSGLQARQVHDFLRHEAVDAEKALWTLRQDLNNGQIPFDAKRAATQAHKYASQASPPAVLRPLGGLSLSARSFMQLKAPQHVTLDSRHTDARRNEPISSPLLERFQLFDFASILALVLPIAAIGLTYGLVQEQRERGTWRMVLAQPVSAVAVFASALALRWMSLVLIALVATCAAFVLDPGATWTAFVSWSGLVALYCLLWVGICGVLSLLPLSSPAMAIAALGLWLSSTFIAPALLTAQIDEDEPLPSRLIAIRKIRDAQLDAETRMPELLSRWYRAHPDRHPQAPDAVEWPASFMPRYLEQEALVRPIVMDIERARAARAQAYARNAWLAPAVTLVMAADQLAGSDLPRWHRYVGSVNAFEDQWRRYFVPRIMSYRGLSTSDLQSMPSYAARNPGTTLDGSVLLRLVLPIALAVLMMIGLKGRLSRPDIGR